MKRKPTLDAVWLKAAVLGCLWASSEIVLGGFLHNLRVPFAGNLLTGVGIVLMVSVAHLWREEGLFWRTGLVCALLKSLSPSAVIFGPMVAIFSESLLMEASVRVFRRNLVGFTVGGMLAMSWNVVQFAANTVLFYGVKIIDFYADLVRYARKQLGIAGDGFWLPIVLLLSLHAATGLIAAQVGAFIGRKAVREPLPMRSLSTGEVLRIKSRKPGPPFRHSLGWLAADVAVLAAAFAFMSFAPWTVWAPLGALVILGWSVRYAHALRGLARPGFWVFFALVTLASGFVVWRLQGTSGGLARGLLIGLEMNFRAAVLIVGFSAVGTELANPRLGRLLGRSRFRQLPAALEAAFEALPLMIANLPRLQDVFRQPVTVFHQLVSQAGFWLERMTLHQQGRPGVVILQGSVGDGKSLFLEGLLGRLRSAGIRLGGILSPAVHEDGRRAGYDLVDVATDERLSLSRTRGLPGMPVVGSYHFFPEGLEAGRRALSPERAAEADLVVVDEVGPWELRNQGWAECLYRLTRETRTPLLWVVRREITGQVREQWSLVDPLLLDVDEVTLDAAESLVLSALRRPPAPVFPGPERAPATVAAPSAAPAATASLE